MIWKKLKEWIKILNRTASMYQEEFFLKKSFVDKEGEGIFKLLIEKSGGEGLVQ